VKPRSAEEAGQIVNREAPIHHSNVMHWSTAKSIRSRVASRVNAAGVKERVLVKTGEILAEKPYVKKSSVKKEEGESKA
jgi:large subunit ribosomal protein L24